MCVCFLYHNMIVTCNIPSHWIRQIFQMLSGEHICQMLGIRCVRRAYMSDVGYLLCQESIYVRYWGIRCVRRTYMSHIEVSAVSREHICQILRYPLCQESVYVTITAFLSEKLVNPRTSLSLWSVCIVLRILLPPWKLILKNIAAKSDLKSYDLSAIHSKTRETGSVLWEHQPFSCRLSPMVPPWLRSQCTWIVHRHALCSSYLPYEILTRGGFSLEIQQC